MKKEKIHIVGMHCASCKVLIEKSLSHAKGVKKAEINYGTEVLNIDYDENIINHDDINNLVQSSGDYRIILNHVNSKKQVEKEKLVYLENLRKRLIFTFIFSIPFILMMIDMGFMFFFDIKIIPTSLKNHELQLGNYIFQTFHLIQFFLSGTILFYGGFNFYKSAWNVLKKKSANMDTLVVLGTTTAWIYSSIITLFPAIVLSSGISSGDVFFEAAVFIILFILTGRYFEEKARQSTRQGVKKLMELQATEATVIQNGVEKKVSLEEVKVNDEIIVKSGGKIPVDGVILEGQATIDESMMSGEPIPVEKKIGDQVIGATIIQSGFFHMRATNVGKDTLLAKIIAMVEDVQGSQAPIQRLADRVAGIFVPIVIVIALLTFSFWYFLAPTLGLVNSDVSIFSFAIYAMTSVLIIACPCALGLATPTAIIVGIGTAAKKGILIKDAAAIENAYKIKTILVDKTGTITEGEPVVQNVKYFGDEKIANELTYSLEKKSDHPLAHAIIEHVEKSKNDNIRVEDFINIDGVGVQGIVENKKVVIAKANSINDYGNVNAEVKIVIDDFKEKGYAIAGLIVDGKVLALYGVADKIKKSSKGAISALHNKGVKVVMLTGDHRQAAEIVAREVGVDEVVANVMPADKDQIVREQKNLLQENEFVAMVGDGINDAPALARADVGIAMGTGTDIAIDSGDIVIVKGSLMKVIEAINLSNRTMKTIKQNLFWAFGYNVVAIPIAAGVLFPVFGIMLSPIIASGAMAFSSVSVVLNSLRLRRK